MTLFILVSFSLWAVSNSQEISSDVLQHSWAYSTTGFRSLCCACCILLPMMRHSQHRCWSQKSSGKLIQTRWIASCSAIPAHPVPRMYIANRAGWKTGDSSQSKISLMTKKACLGNNFWAGYSPPLILSTSQQSSFSLLPREHRCQREPRPSTHRTSTTNNCRVYTKLLSPFLSLYII